MFCGFGGPGFWGAGIGLSSWIFVIMVIKILIFIGLVVFGVKLIKNCIINSSSAIKILDEKFAKGEISEEEYIKRRNLIKQKR